MGLKYSPFHLSLPFTHLGQSSLSVNRVTFFSILELNQCPRGQVFLKSIQHLSLGNDVTFSDKNIVIIWSKHIFISAHTMRMKNTHEIEYGQKQNFINCSRYLSASTWPKFHLSLPF